jgi:hypothetical protein
MRQLLIYVDMAATSALGYVEVKIYMLFWNMCEIAEN